MFPPTDDMLCTVPNAKTTEKPYDLETSYVYSLSLLFPLRLLTMILGCYRLLEAVFLFGRKSRCKLTYLLYISYILIGL